MTPLQGTALAQALAHQRQLYTRLEEALALTRQLSEAVDRNDQVSARMLLSMRGESVEQLLELRQTIRQLRQDLPQEQGQHLADILNGDAPQTPETAALAHQSAVNRRLTEQLLSLDQGVNRKLGRDRSLFAQEAPPGAAPS